MAQCEMCGKQASLSETLIEGTSMNACRQCASYGTAVKTRPQKTYTRVHRPRTEQVPVANVAAKVRRIREKHNLTQSQFAQQIGERESIIPKIESGAIAPLSVLRKIEQRYSEKLTEEDAETSYVAPVNKGTGFTVGDFIKTKK